MGFVSRVRLLLALALVLVQVIAALVIPANRVTAQTSTIQVVPDRYIVVLKPAIGISSASVAASYAPISIRLSPATAAVRSMSILQ